MQTYKLGEICVIDPAKSLIKDLSDDVEVSFLPMADLSQGKNTFDSNKIKKLGEVRKGYTYFQDDDVLLAKVSPCFENGKCGVARKLINGIGFGSSEYIVLRPKENVLSKYIYYIVSSTQFRQEGAKNMSGTVGLQRIKKDWLQNMEILLPPLATQGAIADKLDKLQSLINLKKQAITKNDELAKSIFLEMFGDLRTNEKKWDKKIFTDVVVLKRGHDLPIQDRMAGEYPVIASTNIVGYHNKYKAEGPGVVTGRSGTIGEVQYIEGNYWPLNTALYSESLKGNNPIYVAFFLRAFDLNRYVRGAGVPTLNRNLFNTELVPLPPFPLQQKFADIIAQIEAQKSEHKLALAKLEELYRAEMQRSFSL